MPRGQPLHVAPECAIAALHPARAAETADAGGAPLSPAAGPTPAAETANACSADDYVIAKLHIMRSTRTTNVGDASLAPIVASCARRKPPTPAAHRSRPPPRPVRAAETPSRHS